jgi:hypothetical protein
MTGGTPARARAALQAIVARMSAPSAKRRGSFSRRSHASSNSRADEHLVVVAASTVDVAAVLDYHLYEGRRAGVPAMRLQGRHME